MRFPYRIVELATALLAAATLAYQLAFFGEWPAWSFYPLFALFVLPTLYVFLGSRFRFETPPATGARAAAGLLILAALIGVFTIFFMRPCYDDLWYFHSSLIQADRLDEPFYRQVLFHHDSRLLADPMRAVAAYPRLAMLIAVPLGLDPLITYQYIVPVLAAIVMTMVYFILLKKAGLSDGYSVAGTACAMAFLLSDGGSFNAYGQHSLGSLWITSGLVIGLGLPLAAAFDIAFLRRPDRSTFLRCLLANAAVTGLSSSTFALLPLLAGGLAAAAILMQWRSPLRWWAGLGCVAATAFPLTVGVITLSMLPESLTERSILIESMGSYYQDDWLSNLRLVYENWMRLGAFSLAALLFPFLTLRRRFALATTLYCAVLAALFFNPLVAPLLHDLMTRWAYYRVMYLFPIPLLAGLVPLAVGRWRRAPWGVAATAVVLILYLGGTSHTLFYPLALYRGGYPVFVIPNGVRFFPREVAAARALQPVVENRRVIVPRIQAIALGLVAPQVRLETSRADFTRHVYHTSGLPDEALRRYHAQRFVEIPSWQTPEAAAALRQSIELGVDLIVTELSCAAATEDLIRELEIGYESFQVEDLYQVFVLGSRAGGELDG